MDEILNKQLWLELLLGHLETKSFNKYEKRLNKLIDEVLSRTPYVQTISDKVAFRNFMNDVLTPIYSDLESEAIAEARAVSVFETAFLYKAYRVDKVAKGYLSNINSQTEIHGYKIGKSFKNNKEFLINRLVAIVSNGIGKGLHSSAIKKDILKAKDAQLNHIGTGLINSIIQKARSLEREATYKVIEKSVEGCYVFVSTLDNRTTKTCSTKDSMRFCKKLEDISSGYKPPLHYRCRSLLVYEPKNYIGKTRASKQYDEFGNSKGKPIKDMNYAEWFAFQPATMQQKYLGKKKFVLYKNGTPFNELFRVDKKFSLDEVGKFIK